MTESTKMHGSAALLTFFNGGAAVKMLTVASIMPNLQAQ
jgi:hypothetical protein